MSPIIRSQKVNEKEELNILGIGLDDNLNLKEENKITENEKKNLLKPKKAKKRKKSYDLEDDEESKNKCKKKSVGKKKKKGW